MAPSCRSISACPPWASSAAGRLALRMLGACTVASTVTSPEIVITPPPVAVPLPAPPPDAPPPVAGVPVAASVLPPLDIGLVPLPVPVPMPVPLAGVDIAEPAVPVAVPMPDVVVPLVPVPAVARPRNDS